MSVGRLDGPDESLRLVYLPDGRARAQGLPAVLYAAETGPALADVLTPAGAAVPGSTLLVNAYSQVPRIKYPPGDVDVVWCSVDGGPRVPLYADGKARQAVILPVNARDYGTVGDGVADDTAALAAAMAAAASSGRELFIPPGTYPYTALTITATVRGAGRDKTTLRGPQLSMWTANTALSDLSVIGTSSIIVSSTNASRLAVERCNFSHAAGVSLHLALAWQNVNQSRITNCTFGVGGVQLISCTDFLISGNYWDCQYLNVNEPCHVSFESSGQFVDNTVTRTATDALDLYSSGEYCVVANNRFIGLAGNAGMELKITLSDDPNNSSSPGNIIDGVVVANNVFRDFRGPTTNARAGIFAEYVDSRASKSFSLANTARALVIADNILEDFEPVNPGAGIISNWVGIAFTGHNCRITGNVIRNMRSWNNAVNYGIRLGLYGAGVADGVKCTGVAVSGNTIAGIEGNGSAAVATGTLEQCLITDNVIRGDEVNGTITKWGIDVGTGATLTDTRIAGNLLHCKDPAGIGLRLVGAGSKLIKCQVTHNVFRDCNMAVNVAEHTLFSLNTIDNALYSQASYVGVAGTASPGCSFVGNHVTMSADYGLVLTDVDQFTVDACTFRDCFSGLLLVGAARNGVINGCVSAGQSNTTFPAFSGVSAGDQASISVGINRVNSGATHVVTGQPATASIVAVTGLSCAANTTTTTTVALTGVTTADQVLVVPQASLPAGVVFSHAFVSGANTLTVAFSNTTAGAVSVTVNLQAIVLRRFV